MLYWFILSYLHSQAIETIKNHFLWAESIVALKQSIGFDYQESCALAFIQNVWNWYVTGF